MARLKRSSTQGCGARIVTEGQGELTSPNYPHQWESGGNCSWIIVGAQECKCHLSDLFQFTLLLRINVQFLVEPMHAFLFERISRSKALTSK